MSSSFRLHSKYNPQKEADSFAATVQGFPLFIVVTEPGESYLATSFRKRFPKAKIFAIRYTSHLFLETDVLFDAVWRGSPQGIPFFLINNIPDEYFSRCVFLSWLPSENVWKDVGQIVWKEIKKTSEFFLSIINTRSFFGNTWLKNIFRNLIFSKKVNKINFKKMSSPSFFLTSGPSMEAFIKDNRIKNILNNIFTLSASSSFSSLLYHGVKPSCVISTDGGFWAEPHLKYLKDSLLLFPLEARIPYKVLENVPLAFVSYGSLLESYFFDEFQIPHLYAKRNGTVAGTAIDFLLDHRCGDIYICGLDLSFTRSFTHSRPNENIETNLVCENKMNPASSIIAKSQFANLSLLTYASWFSSMSENKKSRLFRIGSDGVEIEGIKRIDKKNLLLLQTAKEMKNFVSVEEVKLRGERFHILSTFLNKIEKAMSGDEIFASLVKIDDKTLEKEICQFLAFPEYVALIKHSDVVSGRENGKMNLKDENIVKIKESIREKVLCFIEKERNIICKENMLG